MFNKYQQFGAYHWKDVDSSSFYKILNRSLPLYTRYQKCLTYIQGNAQYCIEVGCGDGALSYLIATKGLRVLGCDTDQTGISLAISQVKKLPFAAAVQFKYSRFQDCCVESESVDVIVLADVIEHLEDPVSLLHEIKRTGKPGGRLIITTPKAQDGRLWDNNHVCEYTEETLELLLKDIFPSTTVKPFMPLLFYRIYNISFAFRCLFNTLCLIGMNPFSISFPSGKNIMLQSISYF